MAMSKHSPLGRTKLGSSRFGTVGVSHAQSAVPMGGPMGGPMGPMAVVIPPKPKPGKPAVGKRGKY
jgi:hypothetical protein